MREEWRGFKTGHWVKDVNVRSFIQENYTVYDGDSSFLAGPAEATVKLWNEVQALQKEERAKGGVLDMETEIVSGLTAYGPGYLDESMKRFETVFPACGSSNSAIEMTMAELEEHSGSLGWVDVAKLK